VERPRTEVVNKKSKSVVERHQLKITLARAELLLEVLTDRLTDLRHELRVLRDDPHPSAQDKFIIAELADTETMIKSMFSDVVGIFRKINLEE
jgi:hypothetical protein